MLIVQSDNGDADWREGERQCPQHNRQLLPLLNDAQRQRRLVYEM